MKTTLAEMQIFIAVIETGTLSRAAYELDLTVSAVSRALRRLEEKLDTVLVRRSTRRLESTEEGRTFLEYAKQIIASVEDAEEHVTMKGRHPSGKIRIIASTSLVLHVITPVLHRYQKCYPEIEIEIISNDNVYDLLEHRSDVAVCIGKLKDSGLHAKILGLCQMMFVASPRYIAEHGMPHRVDALKSHRLIGYKQNSLMNDWPLDTGEEHYYKIQPSIVASNSEIIRQLAIHSSGIACLPDPYVKNDIPKGDLVNLDIKEKLRVREPLNAVYYKNIVLPSRTSSFVEFLAESLVLPSE